MQYTVKFWAIKDGLQFINHILKKTQSISLPCKARSS